VPEGVRVWQTRGAIGRTAGHWVGLVRYKLVPVVLEEVKDFLPVHYKKAKRGGTWPQAGRLGGYLLGWGCHYLPGKEFASRKKPDAAAQQDPKKRVFHWGISVSKRPAWWKGGIGRVPMVAPRGGSYRIAKGRRGSPTVGRPRRPKSNQAPPPSKAAHKSGFFIRAFPPQAYPALRAPFALGAGGPAIRPGP